MTITGLNNYLFKITELKMCIEILENKQSIDSSEINEMDLRIESLNQEFKNMGIDIFDITELKMRLAIQKEKPFWNLDVDGDGQVTALGDGLMIIRKMLGPLFAEDELTAGITTTRATNEIHEYIQKAIDDNTLDIDKSGSVTALGDGVMIMRYLLNRTINKQGKKDKIIEDAISPNSPYYDKSNAAESVIANIDALLPTP